MNSPTLGHRIAFFRKKIGLNQKDLAIAVGVTPKAISSYEKNTRLPNILILTNIAGALRVTVDALLGLESSKNNGESAVLRAYRNLNNLGQDRVLEYAMSLEETVKYSRSI